MEDVQDVERLLITVGFCKRVGIFGCFRVGENATTAARDYDDVTLGTNGLYTAGKGWDGPTGLGTPNGVTAFGG